MKLKKFKDWGDKLKYAVSVGTAIVFIFGVLTTVIKTNKSRVAFVKYGSERVDSLEVQVKELRNAVFVLAGALADNMPYVDSCTYYIEDNNGEEIIGRIKVALSEDLYIFIPDNVVGERPYLIGYHRGRSRYHFFNFSGTLVPVYKKE